jgi:hypothetical protein
MEAAVLDAKFQFAEFLGAEASAATLKVADKNPTQRREELDRLDALIKRPGGDPAAETIRDLLQLATSDDTSVAWRNTIVSAGRTAMQRCIYGMVVINTFVDTGATGLEGTIAVVVMYTPKSRLMADALLGARSVPSDQPQGSIKDYVDGLPYDQLAFASGARHRVNERGDRCLLGFGMSSVDGSDPADIQFAMEEATQSATAQLRLVAGELIEADRLSSRTADARKLLDGTVKRESLKSFQNRVSSRAESLQMSGVTTVTTKRLRHNKLGDVVCVVRQWNLSDAKAAAALRAILDEQGGWKGGRGVVPDGRGGTASSSRPIKPSGVPSGSSGETMDDP